MEEKISDDYLKGWCDGKVEQIEAICKLIEKDIKYQKKQLTGNFEKDKAVKWRIIGFTDLIERIRRRNMKGSGKE